MAMRKANLKKNVKGPMKMKDSFLEPNKELKFGGPSKPMKYLNGGRKDIPEGATKKGQYVYDKDGVMLGTTAPGKPGMYFPKGGGDYPFEFSGQAQAKRDAEKRRAAAQKRAQEKNDSAETKKAAEGYTRGQIGTAKSEKQTAPKPKATPAPAPKRSAPKASSDSRPGLATAASEKMEKRSTPSNDSRPGLAKSTTKNVAEGVSTSKKANRIDRRADKVADRKSKDRMANKAARINKRAANVEARKEKKSEVAAAKARLKAARRLQTGGLKTPSEDQKGLKKLPTAVRNKMGYKKSGGKY